MNELVIGPADVKARGGPSDKPLKGFMAGGPITRKDVKRRLCDALDWTPDSIDRLYRGEEPIVVFRAPASALRDGHDGSDGWPRWLEDWLREQIEAIRTEVAEIAQRVEELEQHPERKEPHA